jgi:VIT1/CCC1 family predicted Fe2+/Mn2+ transporter/rubrerythrin
MAIDKINLATVEKMWRREVEAAATYRHLADREADPRRKDILTRLAQQEEIHAARWSERIALTTGHAPHPQDVERGLTWFQRISDPNVVLHRLEQEENKAEEEYDHLMSKLSDPTDRQIAEEAMHEERDHAVILRALAGGAAPTPRSALDRILGRERWHQRGTGWIGDAIYGVNDGLGAVFGIVSGMAGYTGGSEVVLAAGLAGTLASALSMGAGAYLSSKSQREVYESEVARERLEIEEDPHEELLELELFYQLKGFSVEESRALAERLQKEPAQFLRTLVHEELGLNEDTFPNPWRSTISASLSTAVGGFIPIIPFFFTVGMPAVVASFVISTLAHFAVGAAKSLVTTRSWWSSGAEMTMVGVLEAAVTYGLGRAFAGH